MSYPAIFFIKKRSVRFSPAARDYFARLDAAGLRVTTYDAANARLIDRLVANGGNFWPDSGAFCAMAGYLFSAGGTLIPLHPNHDAGTLNAFVTGDWNAVTGLKGDGSTKYVSSGLFEDSFPQNDISISAYINEPTTGFKAYVTGATAGDRVGIYNQFSLSRTSSAAGVSLPNNGTLFANSRSVAGEYVSRVNGADLTTTAASLNPNAVEFGVFGSGAGAQLNEARLPFYHIGSNLSGSGELAELEAAITEWQAALAAA